MLRSVIDDSIITKNQDVSKALLTVYATSHQQTEIYRGIK